ncbi:MAG: hypothetical protein PHE55_04325 [Methylococcaceae bacterium]|nr:hypothetical protein [Methylococcaceae bacterium]
MHDDPSLSAQLCGPFHSSLQASPHFRHSRLSLPEAAKTASPQWIESYAKLPLSFEAKLNIGLRH